ncbi:MAG: hypothetical protein JSV03_17015, partial [Planctomycetota bacterium]
MTKTSYKYARIIITFFVLAILVMTEVAFNGECPEVCEPVGPTGSETTDIIFVVDGSGSIDEVFNLQRQGIWDAVCGPNSVVPSDGSAAIAVIQFSSVQETCVEIP